MTRARQGSEGVMIRTAREDIKRERDLGPELCWNQPYHAEVHDGSRSVVDGTHDQPAAACGKPGPSEWKPRRQRRPATGVPHLSPEFVCSLNADTVTTA